jgi:hypothetical protein
VRSVSTPTNTLIDDVTTAVVAGEMIYSVEQMRRKVSTPSWLKEKLLLMLVRGKHVVMMARRVVM